MSKPVPDAAFNRRGGNGRRAQATRGANGAGRKRFWPTGMRRVTPEIIGEIRDKILGACRPARIILFGSHAYGKPGPDSDVDILVIMRSRKRPVRRRIEVGRACDIPYVPMDLLVLTPVEIRRRLAGFDPFLEEVLAKGKILYESPSRH